MSMKGSRPESFELAIGSPLRAFIPFGSHHLEIHTLHLPIVFCGMALPASNLVWYGIH